MIQNINLNGATVSAELHGYMYDNLYGYNGVFDYGSKLLYELVSNNEIRINDGLLCNKGRFMRIIGSESLSIANGTSGVNRVDLIVAHFETDGINETHDIRVIQGYNNTTIPDYESDDIYNGGTSHDLPLYAVYLNGLSVEKVEKLFEVIPSSETSHKNNNLFVNSDFRNPINQRGLTSYTAGAGQAKYTVDRWIISANETLTVENGYIRVKLNASQTYDLVHQKIPFKKDIVPEVMTLSCKIRASKDCKFHLYDTKRYFEVGTDWTVLNVTFTNDEIGTSLFDDHFRVYLGIKDDTNPGIDNLSSGTYFDIEWAKLEAGEKATEFVQKETNEELNLCMMYYQKYYKVPIYTTSASGVTYRGLLMDRMRTNPTLTIDNLYDGSGTEKTGITSSAKVSSESNIVNIVLSSSVGQYGYASYSLDAEIY